jgi:ppGpp synthetase/RelA/SpoT-type nucleotidyltranferase
MSKIKIDIEKLEQEFQKINRIAEDFATELSRQLSLLIVKENIRLAFPIQNRSKTWPSIIEKINSGRFTLKSSILEMQDLVGIRIILLFKRDTEKIASIIKDNFKIISQYNTEDKLQDNQFGYLSIHQVIELSEEWLKVPTLRDFKGIKAEIQIRTLAQHSWAEASNTFQYKNEANVPKPLKRTINRISALLETVDLEFERILGERTTYKEEIKDIKLSEKSIQPLDVDLLIKILEEKLPKENRGPNEPYGELLENLKAAAVTNSGELISIIDKYLTETMTIDNKAAKEIIAAHENKKPLTSSVGYSPVTANEIERIKKGVFLSHVGIIRHIIKLHTGKNWWELKNVS